MTTKEQRVREYQKQDLSYGLAKDLLVAEFGAGVRKTDYLKGRREIQDRPKKKSFTPTNLPSILYEDVETTERKSSGQGVVGKTATGRIHWKARLPNYRRNTEWKAISSGKSVLHGRGYMYFMRAHGIVQIRPDTKGTSKDLRKVNEYMATPSGIAAGILKMMDRLSRGKKPLANDKSLVAGHVTVVKGQRKRVARGKSRVMVDTVETAYRVGEFEGCVRSDYTTGAYQYTLRVKTAEEIRDWLRHYVEAASIDYPVWIILSEVRLYT